MKDCKEEGITVLRPFKASTQKYLNGAFNIPGHEKLFGFREVFLEERDVRETPRVELDHHMVISQNPGWL